MYGVFQNLPDTIDTAMQAHAAFTEVGKKLQCIANTITSFRTGVIEFPNCEADSFSQANLQAADVWCDEVARAGAGVSIQNGIDSIYETFCESKSCRRTVEREMGITLIDVFQSWTNAVQQLQVGHFCVRFHRYAEFMAPFLHGIVCVNNANR